MQNNGYNTVWSYGPIGTTIAGRIGGSGQFLQKFFYETLKKYFYMTIIVQLHASFFHIENI